MGKFPLSNSVWEEPESYMQCIGKHRFPEYVDGDMAKSWEVTNQMSSEALRTYSTFLSSQQTRFQKSNAPAFGQRTIIMITT